MLRAPVLFTPRLQAEHDLLKAKHALKTTKEALAATQETKYELALTRSVDESTPDARPREDPLHAATLPRGPLVAAALPRRPAAATAEVAPTEVATAGEGGTSRTAAEVMVVDVRRHELFLRGHAADAYNIPWSEMRERGFELPARGRRLAVLTEDDDAEVARARDWFATRSERCLWRVVSVARWRDGEGRGGPSRRGEFLFGASPLLAPSLAWLLPAAAGARARPQRALDVGSGSGRDAALLAASGAFETVVALDRDAKALDRWRALLRRHALEQCGVAVRAALSEPGDVARALAGAGLPGARGWDLVNVSRHLHRPALAELAELLAPGGVRCVVVLAA